MYNLKKVEFFFQKVEKVNLSENEGGLDANRPKPLSFFHSSATIAPRLIN